MAVGKKRAKQTPFWVETTQLQAHTQHPFYSRVNEILEKAKFDRCAERMGRPSITPGTYFRCFFVGYLEGIDSERGIAYRQQTPIVVVVCKDNRDRYLVIDGHKPLRR